MPWYSDEELKAQKQKPYEAPQMEQQSFEAPVQPVMPEKKAPSVRAGSHVTGEIKQVYTDPAVDLGSKRIPINPRSEEAPREDPFAVKHTKEAMRAVSGEYSVPPLMLLKDPQRQLVDTTVRTTSAPHCWSIRCRPLISMRRFRMWCMVRPSRALR